METLLTEVHTRIEAVARLLERDVPPPLEVWEILAELQHSVETAEAAIVRDRERVASSDLLIRQLTEERDTARSQATLANVQVGRLQSLLDHQQQRVRDAERNRSRRRRPAASDVKGEAMRPNPVNVKTAAELIATLQEFRVWAGNPSFRTMAERSGRAAAASTMCALLGGDRLPDRLGVIEAVVDGCGGNEQDRERFASAWRRLTMKKLPPDAPAKDAQPRLRSVREISQVPEPRRSRRQGNHHVEGPPPNTPA